MAPRQSQGTPITPNNNIPSIFFQLVHACNESTELYVGLCGYFAENIIAFLAICSEERRTGVATDLLKQVMVYSKGSIAARLKPDEKIADLFRKSGFRQDAHEFILKR